MSKIYHRLIDYRNMYLIKNSGYFDKEYYKKEYPTVKGNLLKHYYYEGYKIGNNPSKKFYNDYYLNHNADVKNIGINPLLHYIVSGKREGREVKEFTGESIPELYYSFTQNDYFYKITQKESSKNRVTLFLDPNHFEQGIKFITDVYNTYKDLKFSLRIIYKNLDLNQLLLEFRNKNLILPEDTIYLKLNSTYYIEMFTNEKIVCVDFDTAFSLINSNTFHQFIYYYMTDVSTLTVHQQMLLSLFVQNGELQIVGTSNLKLRKYQLQIKENNLEKKAIYHKIGFQFLDMSFYILQQLNDRLLGLDFDQKTLFYYWMKQYQRTICLDNYETLNYMEDIKQCDLIIRFHYEEILPLKDFPSIDLFFNETDEFIDINEESNIFLKKSIKDVKKQILFEEIFEKIGLEE